MKKSQLRKIIRESIKGLMTEQGSTGYNHYAKIMIDICTCDPTTYINFSSDPQTAINFCNTVLNAQTIIVGDPTYTLQNPLSSGHPPGTQYTQNPPLWSGVGYTINGQSYYTWNNTLPPPPCYPTPMPQNPNWQGCIMSSGTPSGNDSRFGNIEIDVGGLFPTLTGLNMGFSQPMEAQPSSIIDIQTISSLPSVCQVINLIPGCTDSTATNYDPNANQDDGSCIYPVTGCNPNIFDNPWFNPPPDPGPSAMPGASSPLDYACRLCGLPQSPSGGGGLFTGNIGNITPQSTPSSNTNFTTVGDVCIHLDQNSCCPVSSPPIGADDPVIPTPKCADPNANNYAPNADYDCNTEPLSVMGDGTSGPMNSGWDSCCSYGSLVGGFQCSNVGPCSFNAQGNPLVPTPNYMTPGLSAGSINYNLAMPWVNPCGNPQGAQSLGIMGQCYFGSSTPGVVNPNSSTNDNFNLATQICTAYAVANGWDVIDQTNNGPSCPTSGPWAFTGNVTPQQSVIPITPGGGQIEPECEDFVGLMDDEKREICRECDRDMTSRPDCRCCERHLNEVIINRFQKLANIKKK